MTKKAASAALIFVLLYNLFLYDSGLGIGTTLLVILFNTYIYFTRTNSYNRKTGLILAILSSCTSLLFAFRANELVQAINLTSAVVFSALAYYFLKLDEEAQYSISEMLYAPLNAAKAIGLGLKELVTTRKSKEESIDNGKVVAIVRGLGITLPVVGVLLYLLYNADPIFAKLTQEFTDSLLSRLITSAIIFTTLFILYKAKIVQTWGKGSVAKARFYEPPMLLISVASVLFMFLAIQIKYVFMYVAPQELQKIGITSLTYSEYVRKGFFELLIASVIASIAIIYGIRSLHKISHNKKAMQILAGIVSAETGLLLVSAGKRVLEYYYAHGLTRARIFGIIFLIWLACALIILCLNIVRKYDNYRIFMSILGLIVVLLIAINSVNVDGVVANVFKPTVNKETDYYYIADLSPDAHQSWGEIIGYAESTVSTIASKPVNEITPDDNRKLMLANWTLERLTQKTDKIRYKYGSDIEFQTKYGTVTSTTLSSQYYESLLRQRKWQSYNISEWNSFQWIQRNKAMLDKAEALKKQIHNGIQNQIPQEVQDKTIIDRSLNPPLL